MDSLQQLKEENAAIEAGQQDLAPQADEVEIAEVEAAEVVETESDDLAESDEEGSAEASVESWMQSEDADSQSDAVPVAAHAKMRSKLKGKINDQNTEIEELRAQMEALKTQGIPAVKPTGRPKRDDFFEHDDPDDAYDDAMFAWRNNQQTSAKASDDQKAQQQVAINNRNESVDQHYTRAAKLAADNNIKSEVYQQSDAAVRNAIGDNIAEALIASMGSGSEKVFFNLGRNPQKLAELQKALTEDPNGLTAMMMLGKMSSELMPQKRKTMARQPATNIKGDQNIGESHKALKKKYQAAHKADNTQEAFNVRRQAKAAGADLNNW